VVRKGRSSIEGRVMSMGASMGFVDPVVTALGAACGAACWAEGEGRALGAGVEVGRMSRNRVLTEPLARQQVRADPWVIAQGPSSRGGCSSRREPRLARRRSAAFGAGLPGLTDEQLPSPLARGCFGRRSPPADPSKQIARRWAGCSTQAGVTGGS